MENIIKFDLTKGGKSFKLLNATNGGPWYKRHASNQKRSNFEHYKNARIPYTRNHDSGMISCYGGPYSHDISKIFRNFDADVNDPKSYDFACTDEDILCALDAGTKTFFRLGETIEHQIVKHAVKPPKDFHKWAQICEHIIMHYTEGWADGFHFDMEYWEIWNEPDCGLERQPKDRQCWAAEYELFFDLYEIAAKHLKSRFPHLKIGGPAFVGRLDTMEQFLREMSKRNVPIDFISWHRYANDPCWVMDFAKRVVTLAEKYGYDKTESILNEWNFVDGWTDTFVENTVKNIHGIKGAAYVMGVISAAQYCNIDMLMYYDTRQSVFNGAFDYYTAEPLKGYYPLYWYGMFYDLEHDIKAENLEENEKDNIYTLCGVDKEGKALAVVTYFSNNDSSPDKDVKIDFGRSGKYEIYLLDKNHDAEKVCTTENLQFKMCNHSCILIKEL